MKNRIALLFLIVAIVVIFVVIRHRALGPDESLRLELGDVVTVDKVELNGKLHHATVHSHTTEYVVFCQDIEERSCLQLHVGQEYRFDVHGTVLYFSPHEPKNINDFDGWRIDKEEKLK